MNFFSLEREIRNAKEIEINEFVVVCFCFNSDMRFNLPCVKWKRKNCGDKFAINL